MENRNDLSKQKSRQNIKDSKKVLINIRNNKKLIKKVFERKIKLINKLIDSQTQLTSLFFQHLYIKDQLREVYKKNVVVDNALLSLTNLTYSIMTLLENSFYGSVRVLLRQYFEYLIVSKFSEFDDDNILKKWQAKSNDNTKFNINLSHDILNKLTGKNISEIRKMWKILSDASHPTKYAQQVPFVLTSENSVSWIKENFLNMHYTFDLYFMLVCMNYHLLISNWGRKSRRWYMGYDKDPVGDWKIEAKIKEEIKSTTKEYYENNKEYPVANKNIKKVISQYKQNWIIK